MIRLLLIFFILFFGLLFSSDILKSGNNERRKNYIILITILLILQSGLRNWAVGSDTYQYYYMFEEVSYDSWKNILYNFFHNIGKDPFYDVFQKFFQVFTDNYQLYLIFVACIFMPALGHFIYKNTEKVSHVTLAYIIYMGYYYGFFSITGIRQTIATAFLLYSFEFLKNRKFIPFILLVILASLFHISALVFIPLYFIANIKKPKLILWLSFIGFPIVMIFKNQLALLFVSIFGMEERFGMYTEQFERGGSFILTTFHLILALFSIAVYNKVKMIKPNIHLFYNTFALALFFFPLQWVNPSAGRISQYFAITMIVWIPYLLDSLFVNSPKYREMIYGLTLFLFIFVTFFAISAEGEYNFFWQYMPIPY